MVSSAGMHAGWAVVLVVQLASQQPASDAPRTAAANPQDNTPLGQVGEVLNTAQGAGLAAGGEATRLGLQGAQNLQGLPDFVRFQTLGIIIQVQQIPVLDPGYWKYVIGDPYDLGRGTREKVRTFPSAMRLAFYGFYQDQLGQLSYAANPDRSARHPAQNAWTFAHGELPRERSPQVLGRFTQAATSRFSPEELVDLLVFSVASIPDVPRSRERWNHYVNVGIYNAAWLGAVWFLSQLAQDNATIRSGRWFPVPGSKLGIGAFATLSRLGFKLRPAASADVRFAVPGLEASFNVGGEVRPEAPLEEVDQHRVSMETALRASWLSYFSRSFGWEVFAAASMRYAAIDPKVDNFRRARSSAGLTARREDFLGLLHTTVALEAGAATDHTRELAWSLGGTVENTAQEVAAGFRASVATFRDRDTADWRGTVFVALSLQPPSADPRGREYQRHAQQLRQQVAVVRREEQRLDLLELDVNADPAVIVAQQRQLDVARRRLVRCLQDAEQSRVDAARARGRKPEELEGYLAREEADEARALTGGVTAEP